MGILVFHKRFVANCCVDRIKDYFGVQCKVVKPVDPEFDHTVLQLIDMLPEAHKHNLTPSDRCIIEIPDQVLATQRQQISIFINGFVCGLEDAKLPSMPELLTCQKH